MKKGSLLLLAGLVLSCYAYADQSSSIDTWGPYYCTSCRLATPMPDNPTLAYILTMERNNYPGIGQFFYKSTGDKYVICNDSYCADYVRTDSGDFEGGNVRRQENAGGSAGGGNENTPGSGGGYGGGGCVGSCGAGPGNAGGGTVAVGGTERLPPTQEN